MMMAQSCPGPQLSSLALSIIRVGQSVWDDNSTVAAAYVALFLYVIRSICTNKETLMSKCSVMRDTILKIMQLKNKRRIAALR